MDALATRALAEAEAAGDRASRADALALQGMTLHYRAIELPAEERAALDHGREHELFERAFAIRRELADPEALAESHFQLGLVHQVLRRDGDTAAPLFREALALVTSAPDADAFLRSEIHRHVGFDLVLREERHDEGIEQLETSLELRRALTERGWTATAHVALALGCRLAGRKHDAIAHASAALAIVRQERLRERFAAAATGELAAAAASAGA